MQPTLTLLLRDALKCVHLDIMARLTIHVFRNALCQTMPTHSPKDVSQTVHLSIIYLPKTPLLPAWPIAQLSLILMQTEISMLVCQTAP